MKKKANTAAKVGRKKKESFPLPLCTDGRECRFRNDDRKCVLLTSTYEKSGACPWCKPVGDAEEPKRRAGKPISAGQAVDKCLKLTASRAKEPTCVFYVGDKKTREGCRATSNLSCKGCRFYSANHAERTRAIAAYLLATEKTTAKLRADNARLEASARNLKELRDYARIGKSLRRYAERRRKWKQPV